MNKKALYESIMRQVSLSVKKALNEESYTSMIKRQRVQSYEKIKKILDKVIHADNDILDRPIIKMVQEYFDDNIYKFIDNVTVREVVASIRNCNPVYIGDSLARTEVISTVWTIIDNMYHNRITYDDLMDAYLYEGNGKVNEAMDPKVIKGIAKNIACDHKYAVDTFIKKFAEDIDGIQVKKFGEFRSKKADITIASNGEKYEFDIKCALEANRDTNNFSVSTKYSESAFSPNKFFAFIDTSNEEFGNIYVVPQRKIYEYVATEVLHNRRAEYILVPKRLIKQYLDNRFTVFADPEDKERLRIYTGLKYTEAEMR